jgi:formylglycine-generating enzyme required for sulfatase activity
VPQPGPERRHLFISYTRVDRPWVDRLQRMMAPMLRNSGRKLRLWDDSQIPAGANWRQEITTALSEARVALLLVSDAFLASEFVMGEEVPTLLAAAEAEGVRILWVCLSPCLVTHTPIHAYQAVLPPKPCLAALDEVAQLEALKTIAEVIGEALEQQRPDEPTPEPVGEPPPRQPVERPEAQPVAPALEAPVASAAETPEAEPVARAPRQQPVSAAVPAARPPETPAGQSFTVTTAQLRREGRSWRTERRQLQVEGVQQELGQGAALRLLRIPAGSLLMGSPAAEPERYGDEGPQHLVLLQGFFMGQTPITQAQWRAVAGWEPREGERWGRELEPNPSRFRNRDGLGEARLLAGETSTDDRPVEQVSWHDAIELCRRLSQRTGRTYTLPSEAQWEYACRAGTSTPFHFGETITPQLANYDGNYSYANGPKGEFRQQTTPVGMFAANAWGLQDTHGNVQEWCLDHWHDSYEGAPVDGSAWLDEEGPSAEQEREKTRLLRGGSWNCYPRDCRSAHRFHGLPGIAYYNVGFRVVCLPQGPSLNP